MLARLTALGTENAALKTRVTALETFRPPIGGADDGKIGITFDALGAAGPTSDVLVAVVGCPTDAKLNALDARLTALEAKVAPLVDSVAAFCDGGNQSVSLTTADVVVRSVGMTPPSNGTILVTSSAHAEGRAVSPALRCSITQGTAVDFSFVQIGRSAGGAATDVMGSGRVTMRIQLEELRNGGIINFAYTDRRTARTSGAPTWSSRRPTWACGLATSTAPTCCSTGGPTARVPTPGTASPSPPGPTAPCRLQAPTAPTG